MVNYTILEISDSLKWNDYLQRFPDEKRDIYFTPEYYQLYEKNRDGKAHCFVFEKDGEVALYPFLINSVNQLGFDLNREYYDIQGAYGYNGIIYSTTTSDFVSSFVNTFENYCTQHNIIAEFVRIGLFFDSKFHSRKDFSVVFDQKNIVINLLNDDIWNNSYEYSTRKNINKALRFNLGFHKTTGDEIGPESLDAFITLYLNTMKRNNADEYYYFNHGYFRDIAKTLGKKALFYFISYKKEFISCELVLSNGYNSYSFLGGTDSGYFHLRPNDFLKHCIINDLKLNEGLNYCLGGGTKGIFNFKRSFCKTGVVDFFIGKKVHNKIVYQDIVQQWEEKYPEKIEKYKNFLLKYHY